MRYLGLSCREKRLLTFEYLRLQKLLVLLALVDEVEMVQIEEIVVIAVALFVRHRDERIVPRPVQPAFVKRTIASFGELRYRTNFGSAMSLNLSVFTTR